MAVKTIKELLAQVDEVGSGYCSFLVAMPKYKVVLNKVKMYATKEEFVDPNLDNASFILNNKICEIFNLLKSKGIDSDKSYLKQLSINYLFECMISIRIFVSDCEQLIRTIYEMVAKNNQMGYIARRINAFENKKLLASLIAEVEACLNVITSYTDKMYKFDFEHDIDAMYQQFLRAFTDIEPAKLEKIVAKCNQELAKLGIEKRMQVTAYEESIISNITRRQQINHQVACLRQMIHPSYKILHAILDLHDYDETRLFWDDTIASSKEFEALIQKRTSLTTFKEVLIHLLGETISSYGIEFIDYSNLTLKDFKNGEVAAKRYGIHYTEYSLLISELAAFGLEEEEITKLFSDINDGIYDDYVALLDQMDTKKNPDFYQRNFKL